MANLVQYNDNETIKHLLEGAVIERAAFEESGYLGYTTLKLRLGNGRIVFIEAKTADAYLDVSAVEFDF